MSKKFSWMKIILTMLISAVIMASTGVGVYNFLVRPEFYTRFMDLGNKYLEEGKYEEAILEFGKAIQISEKSTDARVGMAKGYIGTDNLDKAIEVLNEAQQIDMENAELLEEIVDILKDADPETAYSFLQTYVNHVGEDNVPHSIEELLKSSEEDPVMPEIIPPSGTYVKDFRVRLKSDKTRIGHMVYYTTDESQPTDKSEKYRGSIAVEGNCQINFIAYNPDGDHTEVVTASYTIDSSLYTQINDLISQADGLYKNTNVGTEVGNCIDGAKEELEDVINDSKELVENDVISEEVALTHKIALENAIHTFENKIIVPTDRTALNDEIQRATTLVNNAVEGTEVDQYRTGAKDALNSEIAWATEVTNNLVARQDHIDTAKNELTEAIQSFENKKITQTDKLISDSGAKIGPVTVSLLWNTIDDVDLHVTTPLGDTVYYGNSESDLSGGELDVDRQVGEYVDNPVENIYWSEPPHGIYTVKVNVFSKRTSGPISYKVRVVTNGESKIYEMTTTGGTQQVCQFAY